VAPVTGKEASPEPEESHYRSEKKRDDSAKNLFRKKINPFGGENLHRWKRIEEREVPVIGKGTT